MAHPTRETEAQLRFGDYVIMQIPLNVVLGKLSVNNLGEEVMSQKGRSYHKNYECALLALYDTMLKDKMTTPQINMVKKLAEDIKKAKEELILALNENMLK